MMSPRPWTRPRAGTPSLLPDKTDAGVPRGQPAHHPTETSTMSRTYFGTDGIRGTVGQAPITPDFMLRLGHAVGTVLRSTEKKPTVLIGKDTRISGYMLESSLEAGF